MTNDELAAAESLWVQGIFWTYLLGVVCLSAGLIYALWARAGKPATTRPLAPLVLGAAIGVVVGYLVFGRTAVYGTTVGISAAIADCGVRRAPSVWLEHRMEYECLFSEGWWECYPPCYAERRQQESDRDRSSAATAVATQTR